VSRRRLIPPPGTSTKTAALTRCDGWMGSLSGQYSSRLSREGQAGGRSWSSRLRGMAPTAHWNRDQANAEKMRRGGESPDGSRSARPSREIAPALKRGPVLNTAFIERLNRAMRERLASLTRKCRHSASRLQALHTGMYLIGCTYNFCLAHHELSKAKHWGRACTPAMASGLTDHVWSVCEVLSYKVAPSPWTLPKRRGRPKKAGRANRPSDEMSETPSSLAAFSSLRKGGSCSTTN
jgi:hypothetical protein